jgi:transposase
MAKQKKYKNEKGKYGILGGRPSKLTDELIDQIANFIKTGHTPEATARILGVTRQTLYYWLAKGREIDERLKNGEKKSNLKKLEKRYLRFFYKYEQALGFLEMYLTKSAMKDIDNDPDRALKILNIRFPENWRTTEKQEIDFTNDSGGLVIEIKGEPKENG